MENLQFIYNDMYHVVYHGAVVSVSLCGVSAILDTITKTVGVYVDGKLHRVEYVSILPHQDRVVDTLCAVVDHVVDLS